MKKRNTIIIDDEPNAVRNLQYALEMYETINVVGYAHNKQDAIRLIESFQPDLVFLDIELVSNTGFEVLDELKYRDFELIFVTAYDNYALKAFEYSANNYILKPIDDKVLDRAIERLDNDTASEMNIKLERLKQALSDTSSFKPHKVSLHTSKGIMFKRLDEIIYVMSSGNYSMVYLKDGTKLLITRPLKNVEKLLAKGNFYRIHHGTIINKDEIRVYNNKSGEVTMTDERVLSVSYRKRSGFLKELKDG